MQGWFQKEDYEVVDMTFKFEIQKIKLEQVVGICQIWDK
jgi:hypothetical protein